MDISKISLIRGAIELNEKLYKDERRDIEETLNIKLTPKILNKLYTPENEYVCQYLAGHPETPPETLEKLSEREE